MEEFIQKLRWLVEEGNLGGALGLLTENMEFTLAYANDISMLKSQYNYIRDSYLLKGMIKNEEYMLLCARIANAILALIDKIYKGSDIQDRNKYGQILYRIPARMTTLKETKCVIRIAYDHNTLTKNFVVDDETSIEKIQVTEVMNVELVDTNQIEAFKIRTCTNEEQFVIYDDFTQWIFFVQPLLVGFFPITLKISVVEVINRKERIRNVVFEKEVKVGTTAVEEEYQFEITEVQLANKYLQMTSIDASISSDAEGDIVDLGSSFPWELTEQHPNTHLEFHPETGTIRVVESGGIDPDRVIITDIKGEGFACFTTGTEILIDIGVQKQIEEIEIGTEVLTRNINNNSLVKQIVKTIANAICNEIILINDCLKVTPSETLMTKRGFIRATNLSLQDYLDTYDTGLVKITSLRVIIEDTMVYNIGFESECAFFANGFMVGDINRKNSI